MDIVEPPALAHELDVPAAAHESALRAYRTLREHCRRQLQNGPGSPPASYEALIAQLRALAGWVERFDRRRLSELLADLSREPLIAPIAGGWIQLDFRMRRDLMTLAVGCWEEQTTKISQRLLQRSQTVIDVGAHVGHFTILAANAVGSTGKVFAFEPAQDNVTRLKRNLALNSFPGELEVIDQAVSDEDGRVAVYDDGNTGGTEYSICPHRRQDKAFTARSVSLDTFVKRRQLDRIDMVKVDVEGAELRVLWGMRQTLAANPQIQLIVELHPWIVRPAEVCSFLIRRGLKLRDVDSDLEEISAEIANSRFTDSATILASRS